MVHSGRLPALPWVVEVWPLAGVAQGGTRIWLRANRPFAAGHSPRVTFSFANGKHVAGREAKVHPSGLISVITPAVPALARHAQVFVGVGPASPLLDRLRSLLGSGSRQNSFLFLPEEWSDSHTLCSLPSCDAKAAAGTSMFDVAAGLSAAARPSGMRYVRALPPGSRCAEQQPPLDPMEPRTCRRLSCLFGAHCVGRNGTAAAATRSGQCLCLGPPPPLPLVK